MSSFGIVRSVYSRNEGVSERMTVTEGVNRALGCLLRENEQDGRRGEGFWNELGCVYIR